MASTFSTNLAIELIGTGDQAGTWGTTTNSNLGTLIEQAISGYVTQAVATGTDTTITIPNGSTGVARNMYIELTGTGGTNTNLIVPANKKLYFIFNNSTGAVTVKVSGQTGVSVPTGKKMVLVSNGTDIVNGLNYIADFGTNSFSVTNLTASSATITNLIATSGSITNLVSSDASATVLRAGSATLTHLSATSASITNLALTSLTISSLSITNVSVASATVSSNLTLSGGTANGVLYLNGSKVATSGTALVFDGTNLGIGGSPSFYQGSGLLISRSGYATIRLNDSSGGGTAAEIKQSDSAGLILESISNRPIQFNVNASEQMRLTSTGLGIGTSSPSSRLEVLNGGDSIVTITGNTASGNFASVDFKRNTGTVNAAVRSQSVGGNDIGEMYFMTRPNAGSLTERIRLDSSGNLFVGGTNGNARLTVRGSGTTSATASLEGATSSGATRFLVSDDGLCRWYGTSNAETMRLDNAGNLGISQGNSPTQVLSLYRSGSTNAIMSAGNSNTGLNGTLFGVDTAGNGIVNQTQAFATIFSTSNTERMRLDSSGNLGLGVTPSAWQSGVKAFQNGAGALYTINTVQQRLSLNAYRDSAGTMRYINSSINAAEFRMGEGDGSFQFHTAPSGTAGNTISFTQAMTLDASGNLLVGATALAFAERFRMNGGYAVFDNASYTGFIGGGTPLGTGTASDFAIRSSNALAFLTGGATERARISSGGNLLVGTTTAGAGVGYDIRLAVDGGAAEASIFKTSGGANSYSSVLWNTATTGNNLFALFGTEGTITTRGSITYNRGAGQVAYNITSDVRLKDNIANAADSGDKVDAIKVRQFDWKETGNHVDYGFVAQELHEVAPHAVTKPEDDENMWSVDYSKLVPMLVKEIQSLRARVAQLESK